MEKKEFETLDEYADHLNKNGYTTESGTPIKCLFCESKDLESVDEVYESYFVVEYSKKCNTCGSITGHWAYGNWEVM